jgi:hypothetical protein
MTAPAHLPADQQAVLDLVLRRGRSYAGIARALRLDVDAVRARARDAVATLSAPAPAVPDDRRAQVTDWLLGQAEPAVAEQAKTYLIANPGARDWARTAADSLGGSASARLATLPAVPDQRAPRRPLPPIAGLLAVAVPALAVFGVAIVVGNANEPPPIATTPSAAPAPSAWLAPARPGSKADGAAEVECRGNAQSLVVTAGGLPRSTATAAYTVWLTNGGRREATYVATLRTDDSGRIDGLAPLKVDPKRYREVLVTRQRNTGTPTRPGLVVLRGPLR